MELDITKRERNELLDREDIELDISHSGEPTPSESDVRNKLAAELDLDPLTISIEHVYSSTGAGTSTASVRVFDEPIMDELPADDEEADEAEEESPGKVDEVTVDLDDEDESASEEDEAAEEESEEEETAEDGEEPDEAEEAEEADEDETEEADEEDAEDEEEN